MRISFGRPMIDEAEKEAVLAVMSGDTLVHGPKMKEFEAKFAEFTGAPHALALSSCTAGMHLYYHALGIGVGDEVIVPAQTHTATAHAVEFVGAKPVFVDAESETGNIDIDQIEDKITANTRVISVVHFLGMPVDMKRVMALAKKYDLKVVEDCALAVGTRLDGVHAGLHGDAGMYSFYPVKHMTTAEGGMFICNDPELAHKIEKYRAFGVDCHVGERKIPGVYDVTMLGYNYRLNEIQSAIGVQQVKKVPAFLKCRKENFNFLSQQLSNIEGIRLFRAAEEGEENSYYCLSILLEESFSSSRTEFINKMKEQGVGTSVYYPKPVPYMSYYREKYGEQPFPVAATISDTSVALPVGPHLTREDMTTITEAVKESLKQI